MTGKDTNTEARILEAAKEVFMRYGLYGARMQDIANTAGINKALLHYYFRNKEKLFDAVFNGALEKYFDQMTVFSETELPFQERLFKYIDNIFEFFQEYPQMSMFIIKEISVNPEMFHERVQHLKKNKHLPLLPSIRKAMENGEIDETDPLVFMINLHSLCAYPFIASPIFHAISKNSGETYDTNTQLRIKDSVKDFVSYKLNKHK
jgi:AcrR family transcriptional regulator